MLFGTGLAVVILLAGPLLLFNPLFTSLLQARHGVADAFATSPDEVGRVTGEMLGDIFTDGSFDAAFAGEEPLLDPRERSHMSDVSRLVRLLVAITAAALLAVLLGAWLLRREPARRGRIMLTAAGSIGALALALAVVFAVAFEPAFLAFHAIFFPAGTYLFAPGSDLITLFPGGFWFDATLAAGASIVLVALVVLAIGFGQLRSADRTRHRA